MAKLLQIGSIICNGETSAPVAFDCPQRFPESFGRVVPADPYRVLDRWWGAIKIFSALCVIFMGLGGCTGRSSMENVSLDNLINTLEKRSYLVKQFRAEFVKVRRSPVFKRDLTVKGRLIFQRPSKFVLTMSGDVNVEILSDGGNLNLIHDQKDIEAYQMQGERDVSRFADPLMMVIQSIGDGGMRRFSLTKKLNNDGSVVLDAQPNGQVNFERIEKAEISISDIGEIEKVSLLLKDGNRDETHFRSWALLSQDDPAILDLNSRLENLSQSSRVTRLRPERNEENASISALGMPLISFHKSGPNL